MTDDRAASPDASAPPGSALFLVAASAHPTITLTAPEALRARLDTLAASHPGTTFAADLYLAAAALEHHPGAVAELDRRLRAVAPQALAGARDARLAVDDVLQDLREKLLVGEDGGKLAQYSGRGPLDGWLRVTIARAALDRLRQSDGRAAQRQDLVDLARGTSPSELSAILERRYLPALEEAVANGLATLPEDERAIVQLHFVDGLTIDDLAALLGIHRATAARRLARAREHVKDVATKTATERLGISAEELESILGILLSRIDLNLGDGIVRTPRDGGEPGRTAPR